MPCTEVVNAINWSQQTTKDTFFPVFAYFTKHFGFGDAAAGPTSPDNVHYASGNVDAVSSPKPHLRGTLLVSKNSKTASGAMEDDPRLTYDVEIYPDGELSYLMRVDNKAAGAYPATQVQATCVNNVLLTGTHGSEVVTVGVALGPKGKKQFV